MSTHLNRRALLLAGAGTFTTAALLTFQPAVAGTTSSQVFTGKFTDPDGPDWVYLPFDVPAGVNRIDVSYTYTPVHTPVGLSFNVVDIGIFDPSGKGLGNIAGFRGWSGGARSSFTLAATDATPGYLPGPITPGRWRIALGPYQIQKPGTPYEVRVTLTYGEPGATAVANPAPRAVEGTGAGWYRGDLHVHTVHSDGSQTQADVLQYAAAAGLDFIGTSEHNTSSAQWTWGDYLVGDYADFLVIAGEEVTTRAGHWLATGLRNTNPKRTWVDWRYRPEDHQLKRFTKLVRDQGGLSIAAHPYQLGGGITWEFGYDFGQMDAIEVWNGPWSGLNAVANGRAVTQWHNLLVKGVFKPAVGNSDTHKQSQQIGLAQTVVRAESLSADAIIAGYRGGHSWITGSSAVGLTFTASLGDVTGECGDRVRSRATDQVGVHLEVTGVDGAVATLIGPKGVLATAPAVDGTITLDTTVKGGTAFIRVEVKAGSTMVALTNPIFLA
ncbi:CehA/McbA family metallohydrolase [Nocardioides sp. CN2-186]|uniref:CehA/McbA family metallohydrolase n=1 Tax=Nocardioides tweenelious TaxID=3156607 RepID=UPI0032B4D862